MLQRSLLGSDLDIQDHIKGNSYYNQLGIIHQRLFNFYLSIIKLQFLPTLVCHACHAMATCESAKAKLARNATHPLYYKVTIFIALFRIL